MSETTPQPPFGETTMTLDHQIDNLLMLLASAEERAEEASQAANEAEDRANELESTDIPEAYDIRSALDTLSDMKDALATLRNNADFTDAQTAASRAREAADDASQIVREVRAAVDALIVAVRNGATASPSPLDLARAEAARLAVEEAEAEADYHRAYRRRNDALHAAANAAAEVRRLEAAGR